MHPALENLCGPGKPLKAEAPDAHEFAGLLRTGMARPHDARNLGEYEGLLDVDERLVFAGLKSQFATSSWGGRRKLPFAFTEHGAIMAARASRSGLTCVL